MKAAVVIAIFACSAISSANAANYRCAVTVEQSPSGGGSSTGTIRHEMNVPVNIDFSRFPGESEQDQDQEINTRSYLRQASRSDLGHHSIVHRELAVPRVCGVEGAGNLNLIIRKIVTPSHQGSPATLGLRVDLYDALGEVGTGNGAARGQLIVSAPASAVLSERPPSVISARTKLMHSGSVVGCTAGTLEIECTPVAGR